MQNVKKIPEQYDVAIIGSDLSALILAQLLSAEHDLKTVLVSTKQSLEDFRKGAEESPIQSDEDLIYFPYSEDSRETLNWFAESVLREKIADEVIEQTPKTFESGEFKPFVGFGERKFKTSDVVDYYLCGQQFNLTMNPKNWITLLLEKYQGDILHKLYPTQVVVEEGAVKSLILNDAKKLVADKFIFCGSNQDLIELLPGELMPGRVRQKLAKAKVFHRINLTVQHSEEFDHNEEVHVLMGTKDEFEPVVGQFTKEGETLRSTWTYLMDSDEYDDPETMTSIVKYMKRQIKRAYPESFEGETVERYSVHNSSHGGTDMDSTRMKTLSNFYMGSSLLSGLESTQAKIKAAQNTYDEFFAG